ncbi:MULTISPECIES: hypothetical protein [Arthrobacter]|uniref:hypothetical protein n=1 Tax=Arthrobacter TaxID=1663 RepID=UPI0011171A74|nr:MULTISPECIES: hypothetical protein [Arthrobacter]MDQ0212721.1 hypothetical protein [Arthrobacter bambusae]MDQ0237146.1 hypothetical protein [Arthrobacter bambusae]
MADAVKALHLVGPGGRQHWIERAASITDDQALRRTYPGIEIHRDDDLLAAAVVSVGRFGIIYSVLLDVLVWLALLLAWLTSGPAALLIPAMTILLLATAGMKAGSGRPGDLVAGLCRWANRKGWWKLTSWIVRRIVAGAERPNTQLGVGFEIMAGPQWADEYYRGRGVEVFLDATSPEYLDVITQQLLPVIETAAQACEAVAGWFSLWFTPRSGALLAMQRWDRTVSVEGSALSGIPGSLEVMRQLEAAALVHWGQQHDLDADAVERAYPALPRWRQHLNLSPSCTHSSACKT